MSLDLPNDPTAPGVARQTVRRTLTSWHLPALVDNAVLAVSELVTNAVRHGLPPLGLRLSKRASQVRMDVSDARADGLPTAGRSADDDESGRGLSIIKAVSDQSGSEHIPGDGKNVFASWDLSTEDVDTAASLPRKDP